MKEEISDENILINEYNLSETNKDNNIEFDAKYIETIKESSKEYLSSQKEKMKLKYSLKINMFTYNFENK